jgi:hypothetical protein
MTPDTISRSAAKALIKKERLDCIDAGAIGAANTCGALIDALDSLPAAEADGRWETLKKWLPVVAEDWDRAGMPQKKFAVAYIIDKMDQIDAVLAAPSPPAAEGTESKLTDLQEINAAVQKPFHKAECECERCLRWHRDNDISNSDHAAQLRGEG